MRFWPPYLGAGISVSGQASDFTWIETSMKLHFWNNPVRVHFGGSLYAMADPFYMLILLHHLGKDFVVWDKAATIRFKNPGKGLVKARFEISPDEIALIKAEAEAMGRCEPKFETKIVDSSGTVVAEVQKVLSVKRKNR